MKTKSSYLIVVVSTIVSMFLVSCGKKEADTLDSLADEIITQINRMPAAMSSIKDAATAEEAAKTIREVGDELVAIAERMEKLEVPSEEEKNRIDKKIDQGTQQADNVLRDLDPEIMSDPEIQKIVGAAMKDYMQKMQKADRTFKKYGRGAMKSPE